MISGYTNDEIIKALELVRNICKNYDTCHQCPFYNIDCDACVIQYKEPCDWILANECTIWRAVK